MKIIGYTRVSTDAQEFNTSFTGQAEQIEAFCQRDALHLVRLEREVGSGADSHRTVLLECLTRLMDGDADGLICTKIDRFSRSVLDGLRWAKALQQAGKFLLFTSLPNLDLTRASGLFQFTLLLAVAQFERAQIAERTAEGRALKFLRDGYAGGRAAFGTVIDKGLKCVEKAESSAIAAIQVWRQGGLSLSQIVSKLEERRVPTKRGGSWSKSTVWQILRRLEESKKDNTQNGNA